MQREFVFTEVYMKRCVCLRSVIQVHSPLTLGILLESFLVLNTVQLALSLVKPSCNFVFLKGKLSVNKIK